MFSRFVTFSVTNLLKDFPSQWATKLRSVSTTNSTRQKKGKKKKGGKEQDTFKMIKAENCADLPKPILEPLCKNAIVVGGSNGFGFAAADYLLCKGARGIVIVDDDADQGKKAAQKLCDSHGKNRAFFIQSDIRNMCQFEGYYPAVLDNQIFRASLRQALYRHKNVHILFNDLDKQRFPLSSNCSSTEPNLSNATKAIHVGMKIMAKNHGGPGGVIVSCASIFGFLGWPEDPFPIYCMKEPAIESTMDLAKEYNVEETGVRLLALCPTKKSFTELGLPNFPDSAVNDRLIEKPSCIPTATWRVGKALSYVMAWGKTGSTWIVEPDVSPRDTPMLIHFPAKEGEKVDPKIYDTPPYPVTLEPHCADVSKSCTPDAGKSCEAKPTKRK